MRSFHQWMECQQYYSHLKNLVKIKKSPSPNHKFTVKERDLAKSICSHRRPFSISSLSRKKAKIQPIFFKNQQRQQIIMKENMELATRIMNVSSVISRNQQINSYRRLHSVIKRKPNSKNKEEFKQKKLKSFFRINEKGINQYLLRIAFLSLPKCEPKADKVFWFQLILGEKVIKSKYYEINQLFLDTVEFPMKNGTHQETGYLQISCYRGLQYIDIGKYKIQIPALGQKLQISSINESEPYNQISMVIQTQRVRNRSVMKKFMR